MRESKTEIVGRVGTAATFVALCFCLLWIKADGAPLSLRVGAIAADPSHLETISVMMSDVLLCLLFLKPSSPARGRQARV